MGFPVRYVNAYHRVFIFVSQAGTFSTTPPGTPRSTPRYGTPRRRWKAIHWRYWSKLDWFRACFLFPTLQVNPHMSCQNWNDILRCCGMSQPWIKFTKNTKALADVELWKSCKFKAAKTWQLGSSTLDFKTSQKWSVALAKTRRLMRGNYW